MSSGILGRYVPNNTFIHKLDPRTKVFCLIVLMVAVFYSYPTYETTFIMGGLLLIFNVFLMLLSKVSFKSFFSSLKGMWFFILFLLILNIFIPSDKEIVEFAIGTLPEIAFSIGSFNVYWGSICRSIKIILRLFMMFELTMVLTTTTSSMDLTYALEWFMTPLKIIKFPAHEIAMTISLALRLIPTLLDETEKIMKAQASRGVDFKHGKLKSRLKAITSLIVPLFVSAFQRSDELANAMEARGYNPKEKRTRYRIMHFSIFDLFVAIISIIILVGVILISEFNCVILVTPHFLPLLIIGILSLFIIFIVIGIFSSYFFKKEVI